MTTAMAEDILGGDERVFAPMSLEQIFYKVCEIMKNEAMVDIDTEIRMVTLMWNDLGMDSLDFVDLGKEIEQEFGVRIPDADFYKMNSYSVGTLCEIVERELQNKANS